MSEGSASAPQLSVVAVSRNDDHGGNMLERMQHFVNGFIAQCRRHELSAELILVEWNPPRDRPPLAQALGWPEELGPASVRIITVPPELHATFENGDQLPLFQMIAKNVGIRRARGAFVLATNIDILFSDSIIRYMRDALRPGQLLRADRCDVPPELPSDAPIDRILAYCAREMFRINARGKTLLKRNGKWVDPARQRLRDRLTAMRRRIRAKFRAGPRVLTIDLSLLRFRVTVDNQGRWIEWQFELSFKIPKPRLSRLPQRMARLILINLPRRIARSVRSMRVAFSRQLRRLVDRVRDNLFRLQWRRIRASIAFRLRWRWDSKRLHTNACGDFTLLARQDWFQLRGYPEWPIFSWHVDSVLLYQASRSQIREIDLPRSMPIYHIEHAHGSGYTPEGVDLLFKRLVERGIPYLSNQDFVEIVREMDGSRSAGHVVYNSLDWGLAKVDLVEWSPHAQPRLQAA
jgi:hypothetical protein